jgi:hypothetical protein
MSLKEIFSMLSALRHSAAGARAYGRAVRWKKTGQLAEAYESALQAIAEVSALDRTQPPVIAVFVPAVVLLDSLAVSLGRRPPMERLREALEVVKGDEGLAGPGSDSVREHIDWLRHRIEELDQG